MQLSISQRGLRNAERETETGRERATRQQLQIVAWPDPMIASEQRLYWGSLELPAACVAPVGQVVSLFNSWTLERAGSRQHRQLRQAAIFMFPALISAAQAKKMQPELKPKPECKCHSGTLTGRKSIGQRGSTSCSSSSSEIKAPTTTTTTAAIIATSFAIVA